MLTSPPLNAVFIGRFQPPHQAHLASIVYALTKAPHILILLGSANMAPSIKNPLNASERVNLLQQGLTEMNIDLQRVQFQGLPDHFDAEAWATDVRQAAIQAFGPQTPVALVGFEKDLSSAYLNWFPDWERIFTPETPSLSATHIRRAWLTEQTLPKDLPTATKLFLKAKRHTPFFQRLQQEWQAIEQQQYTEPQQEQLWFNATATHIQLHQRHHAIGQGLWELPRDSSKSKVKVQAVFEHPARSLLGPLSAQVICSQPIHHEASQWLRLDWACRNPRRFFADHHVILQTMLAKCSSSP